jgi:hypothetical protein
MVVLLRSRGRLRCLLAMALLAWLMLAIAPFGAWTAAQPAPATTMHASHASMPMDQAGCCDGAAHDHAGRTDPLAAHPCHCALPCAGMLPATHPGLAALPAMPARYASPRPQEAPLSGHAPPLRPPLA